MTQYTNILRRICLTRTPAFESKLKTFLLHISMLLFGWPLAYWNLLFLYLKGYHNLPLSVSQVYFHSMRANTTAPCSMWPAYNHNIGFSPSYICGCSRGNFNLIPNKKVRKWGGNCPWSDLRGNALDVTWGKMPFWWLDGICPWGELRKMRLMWHEVKCPFGDLT